MVYLIIDTNLATLPLHWYTRVRTDGATVTRVGREAFLSIELSIELPKPVDCQGLARSISFSILLAYCVLVTLHRYVETLLWPTFRTVSIAWTALCF